MVSLMTMVFMMGFVSGILVTVFFSRVWRCPPLASWRRSVLPQPPLATTTRQTVSAAATAGGLRQRSLMRDSADTPEHPCPHARLSRRGSNQWQTQVTCLDCGWHRSTDTVANAQRKTARQHDAATAGQAGDDDSDGTRSRCGGLSRMCMDHAVPVARAGDDEE